MSETVINLFLDILAAVYTNFAILYFSRRLLPVRNKISLFFLMILFTLPMSLCFLMKRSTLSGEFTILIQLLMLGCIFIGFHASFLQKLAVYFIFVLLETCAEIVASSVFLQIHNLLFPAVMYTPSTLRSQCSPVEFLIIQFFNMALGLFLLKKVAHILQQCFSYLKTVTFFELLSPVILPALANNLLAFPGSLFLRIFFCILYWILCILGSLLFYRAICTLRLQHEKHICHQQKTLLLKEQLNASQTLSAEYASLRKWNHDIGNHLFSLSYLINAKNYSEADKYLRSVLSQKATLFSKFSYTDRSSQKATLSHTFEKTDSPSANFAGNPLRKQLWSIPLLFINLFLFQFIYFLATLYPQKTSLEFFILGVLLVFICIIFYQTLNDQLKKIQVDSEFSMLQKQHQMEQEQIEHLHFRTEETYALQTKTESALTHIRDLLNNQQYPEATAALDSFSHAFQKTRFHPYCQNNLLQAILEGKRLRAEQEHIQVSYEILLPEKIPIDTADLSSTFFNLLDNAIEACNASGNPNPEIRLSANISNGFLTVYMHNTKNPLQTFTHKTTKSKPESHGYGLSIIEDICQRYNGSYQWIDKGKIFYSIVLLQYNTL